MRWPWQKHRPQGDTGGKAARERAEAALDDVRARSYERERFRRWFLVEAEANHYGEHVQSIFRGGKS